MKITNILFSLLVILILQTSCRPEEDLYPDCFHPHHEAILPEADGTGTGGLGCYENGRKWVNAYQANSGGSASSMLSAYYELEQYAGITAKRRWDTSCISPTSTEIRLGFTPVELGDNTITYRERIFVNVREDITYHLDTLSPFNVHLTHLDKEEGIISGTFEFTAISNEEPRDTIVFTDGRFDTNFRW